MQRIPMKIKHILYPDFTSIYVTSKRKSKNSRFKIKGIRIGYGKRGPGKLPVIENKHSLPHNSKCMLSAILPCESTIQPHWLVISLHPNLLKCYVTEQLPWD